MDERCKNKLVLGTAGLAGLWGEVNENESIDTLVEAIDAGINHFDTSPAYADAESILGKALKHYGNSEPLFISTKAGKLKSDSPDSVAYDFTPDALRRSVENSLTTLGVSKIDYLFLHDPTGLLPNQIEKVIETLMQFKQAGIVDYIGIGGNYNAPFEPYVLGKYFDCFMGFNRYNLITRDAVEKEFVQLRREGIQIWQASPLYMGLMGVKFATYMATKPSWIDPAHLARAAALQEICTSKKLPLTAVALQFLMQSNQIDKMVLGASNRQELAESIRFLSSPEYSWGVESCH